MTIASQFANMTVFWRFFVSPVKFSYWFKFHVDIITDSGITIILFYKGLTINLKNGNTPVWVVWNIWGLGQVRDTKFGMNVYNEMLMNAANFQDYSFYGFWVIKVKLRKVQIIHTELIFLSQLTFTGSKSTTETLEKRCEVLLKLTIKTP